MASAGLGGRLRISTGTERPALAETRPCRQGRVWGLDQESYRLWGLEFNEPPCDRGIPRPGHHHIGSLFARADKIDVNIYLL